MPFEDMLDDRQPEAHAPLLATTPGIDPEKTFCEARDMFFLDTDAGISDGQAGRIVVNTPCQ